MLENVAAGVNELKEIALEMGKVSVIIISNLTLILWKRFFIRSILLHPYLHSSPQEAEAQGIMLDNLDSKVDKVNDQLENINIRLRKALESVCFLLHLLFQQNIISVIS
jgi:hypothetical protein